MSFTTRVSRAYNGDKGQLLNASTSTLVTCQKRQWKEAFSFDANFDYFFFFFAQASPKIGKHYEVYMHAHYLTVFVGFNVKLKQNLRL